MCEPTMIIAGITAVSTIADVYGQRQQAKQQTAVNVKKKEATEKSYRANLAQTNLMRLQEYKKATTAVQESSKERWAAQSTAMTSAGESGVGGNSVQALLDDLRGQQGSYDASVKEQYDQNMQGIAFQQQNLDIDKSSQLNLIQAPAKPNYLGGLLRIGGAVAKAY